MKKIVYLFQQLYEQWKRRKFSFFLRLLFPFLLIGLLGGAIGWSLFGKDEGVITYAVIDLDQSEETEVFLSLLEEGQWLDGHVAFQRVQSLGNASPYRGALLIPKGFTSNLYEGHSVTLDIYDTGRGKIESYMLYTLAQSIARSINESQAAILTIHQFAKEEGLSKEARDEQMFEQFMHYAMQIVAKDRILEEEVLQQTSSDRPIVYWSIRFAFWLTLLWTWLFYQFFGQTFPRPIRLRLQLYDVPMILIEGVRLLMTLFVMFALSIGIIVSLRYFLPVHLVVSDYFWLLLLFGLLISCTTFILSIIERVVPLSIVRLTQLFTLIVLVVFSGGIIPLLYAPFLMQKIAIIFYSTEFLTALEDLLIYDQFTPPIFVQCITLVVFFIVWVIVQRKERVE